MRSTIFFTLIAAFLAPALAVPRPMSETSEATEGSSLTARQSCSGATSIDINFDVNLTSTFATCTGANKDRWESSTTPQDFAYCRTEIFTCRGGNAAGVCVKGSKIGYCKPAKAYCQSLGGHFGGTSQC